MSARHSQLWWLGSAVQNNIRGTLLQSLKQIYHLGTFLHFPRQDSENETDFCSNNKLPEQDKLLQLLKQILKVSKHFLNFNTNGPEVIVLPLL